MGSSWVLPSVFSFSFWTTADSSSERFAERSSIESLVHVTSDTLACEVEGVDSEDFDGASRDFGRLGLAGLTGTEVGDSVLGMDVEGFLSGAEAAK